MTHLRGEMSRKPGTSAPAPTKQAAKPVDPNWASAFKDTTKMSKSHGGRVIRKGW